MGDTLYMLVPIEADDPEAVAFVARQAQRCAERSLAAGDTGAGPDELRAIFRERGWPVEPR